MPPIAPVGARKAGYGTIPPDQPLVLPPDPPRPSLIGTTRACFGLGATPSAAHRGLVHLFNPVPTDPNAPTFLIDLEGIYASTFTSQVALFLWRYDGITSASRTQAQSTGTRDTRLGRYDCIMQLFLDDVVLAGIPGLNTQMDLLGQMNQVSADATNKAFYYDWNKPLRLAPGTGFFVAAGLDGNLIHVTFFTRERRVTEQELAQLVLN